MDKKLNKLCKKAVEGNFDFDVEFTRKEKEQWRVIIIPDKGKITMEPHGKTLDDVIQKALKKVR